MLLIGFYHDSYQADALLGLLRWLLRKERGWGGEVYKIAKGALTSVNLGSPSCWQIPLLCPALCPT